MVATVVVFEMFGVHPTCYQGFNIVLNMVLFLRVYVLIFKGVMKDGNEENIE